MPGLEVYLFGAPRVALHGTPLDMERHKALALLAFLAVTGQPHGRAALAALLWPELDQQRAHAALRRTLFALHHAIGKGWLSVEQDQVALLHQPGLAVDVVRFRSLLAAVAAHGHPPLRLCDDCLAALAAAADLCRGDFLAGFSLRDAVEFDAWQSYQAENLRLELAGALERLVQAHAIRGAYEPAIAYARRWLALDPLCEAVHRTLMQLHAWAGNRSAALRQYEECVQALADELDIEPDPETTELYEAVRAGSEAGPSSAPLHPLSPVPLHNLPPDPTPFVGREPELAQLADRLADPACRLLTMVGPGGIGKTRLALRAAAGQLERFIHGVYFVDLAPVGSADLLAATILRTLPNPPHGVADAQDQLLRFLRDKHLLLVLDSFEHLLAGAGLVSELLRAAPRLKVLVTSRVRLNLREEWLAPLAGLELPGDLEHEDTKEHEEREARSPRRDVSEPLRSSRSHAVHFPVVDFASLRDFVVQPAVLDRYSATALFLGCVRRLRPEFEPSDDDAGHIVQVCRLLEGMPLGIELAAARTQSLPVGEIARELGYGLDLLATALRDVPPRHRSMVAAFDHSWRLLSARERSILRQVSVFRGGFTREAAAAVMGATLADLEVLADASWLRVGAAGRYEMHELIRQYCGAKLEAEHEREAGESGEQVRGRHAAYYASYLGAQDREFHRRKEAPKAMAAELGNVLAVWDWAIARGEVAAARQVLYVLCDGGVLLGWLHTALRSVSTAVLRLKARDDRDCRPDIALLLVEMLQQQAGFLGNLGLFEPAQACAEEGLALLRDCEAGKRREELEGSLRWELGYSLVARGQFAEAMRLWEEWLARSPSDYYRWQLLQSLGGAACCLGRYAEAQRFMEQAVAAGDRMGELARAHSLRLLGSVLHARGDDQQAEKLIRESLRVCQAFGDLTNAGFAFHALGLVEAAAGRYPQARACFSRSLAMARQSPLWDFLVWSLNGLAAAELALGRPAEARRLYQESLALFDRPGAIRGLFCASTLVGLGQVALATRDVAQAKDYFRQALGPFGRAVYETAHAIEAMAEVLLQEGDIERAVELLAFVVELPATWHAVRQRAAQLLRELEAELPPEAFAAAMARGRRRQLDDVVAELVAQG